MNTNAASKFQRGTVGGRRQRGAALVVGLVLLMILTLLAISGMNTSTLELQMAGNFQFSQNAFQAAEIGLQRAMAGGKYATNAEITTPATLITGSATDTPDTYESKISFDCAKNGETVPPPRPGGPAFSIGENMGFSAYHFEVESTGRSQRGARAVNVQDFYLVRQEGGCPGF
jgi:type IV pilus assembly protein PilX